MRRYYEVQGLLMQTAAAPPAPATDVNATTARPEPAIEWVDGELPEQGFGRSTLMPGIRVYKLPANLAQLWHDVEAVDKMPFLRNGQPNPTKGLKVKRRMLKMDRSSPLVVEGGADHGLPLTWNPSSSPRARGGKADDPKTAWVSELAYLLDVGLQGGIAPTQRVRPASIQALEAEINKYAGKLVRLDTGLSANCRPDAVRYIAVEAAGEGGAVAMSIMKDPSGQKGCGSRYYTKDFKNPGAGQPDPDAPGAVIPPYDTEIPCTGRMKQPDGSEVECGAALRGFEAVDRILPPLGV
jgi:hypothetical protein